MAEFEPPPPAPREPRRDPDAPRRDEPYYPPERRYERAPRANLSDWTPRLAAILVLVIIVVCYVTTARRDLRPAGFPYSLVGLLALAFVQWAPMQRTPGGKVLVSFLSVGGALVWLALSHFQW